MKEGNKGTQELKILAIVDTLSDWCMWKAVIPGTGMTDPRRWQSNLPTSEGLQAMEMVSEPLCSREGTAEIQIKNCLDQMGENICKLHIW